MTERAAFASWLKGRKLVNPELVRLQAMSRLMGASTVDAWLELAYYAGRQDEREDLVGPGASRG